MLNLNHSKIVKNLDFKKVSMKKKNLIFFLPNFSSGGAGKSILNICKNLNQKKYYIYVISLQKNFYKESLNKYCKKVLEINGYSTLFSLQKIENFLKNFDKSNTLIVSNINYANALFAFYFKYLKNYKLTIIERTPYQELNIYYNLNDKIKKLFIKFFINIFYSKVDALIANSKKTAKDFEKIIKKKCYYIYPLSFEKSINIKKKKKLKKEINILTVGRLSREKNIEEQIYALKKINNKNIKLNIIGDGLLKKKLIKLIKNLNVRCKVYNYSDKIKNSFFLKSDLYICSSDFEGFPNTVVEAINYGLPVISSNNHGGINEILLNGSGGEFYKHNNIENLAKKIKKIIKFYPSFLEKNFKAQKKLYRFSSKNINKYENIFDNILNK